jgi:NAD(P)-dependent dehydrogenase (short-subunit alcohol dehydrogenase family)
MRNAVTRPNRPVLERFVLSDRIAIVTGGSSTLGAAIASSLAQAGATVVLASRGLDGLEEAAKAIDGAEAAVLDLTDEQSITKLIEGVVDRHGRIDVLVNNAVSWFPGHLDTYEPEQWEASLRVDGTGMFTITQGAVRQMVRSGGGAVVNIASVFGIVSADPELYPAGLDGFRPPYFFAKAGMINYTRFLAVAHARDGIRANCISPGAVLIEPPRPSGMTGRVPMRRPASPDEIGAAAVFLASDAASYITGHNLVVDGGYTAL